jgi:hypothetical protein
MRRPLIPTARATRSSRTRAVSRGARRTTEKSTRAAREEALRLARALALKRAPASPAVPPPCFFFALCRRAAEVEKCGRSVCRDCAARRLRGREYTLRDPTPEPLYASDRDAADAFGDAADSPPAARRGSSGRGFPPGVPGG